MSEETFGKEQIIELFDDDQYIHLLRNETHNLENELKSSAKSGSDICGILKTPYSFEKPKARRKNIKWADEDGRDIESTMLIPTRYQMAELHGWSYYYNPDYHPRENRATISSEEKSWLRRSVEIPDDWEFFDADKPSNCPLSEFPMTSMLSTGCCTVSSKKKNDKKRRREKPKSTEQIVNGLMSEMPGNMKVDAGKRKLPSLHGELPSKQRRENIKWADEDGRDIESTMLIPTRYQMAELYGWSYYYNPDYHPRENRATISSEEKSWLRRSVEIPDDWKFFDADKPSNCPLSEFPMTSMLSTGYCTVSSKKKNDKKRRREKPKSTEQIVNGLMSEMPGNMKVDAGKRKLPSLHGELPSKQRRENIKWADEDGRDIESTMLIPTRYQMAELHGWSYYYNPDYHPRENRATISSEEKSGFVDRLKSLMIGNSLMQTSHQIAR
ncbi:hypothetical protein ACOME3_000868 [Neoechinorhynchus agilis]